ncbi:uncharacterized protein LOC144425804 [Styela clava]
MENNDNERTDYDKQIYLMYNRDMIPVYNTPVRNCSASSERTNQASNCPSCCIKLGWQWKMNLSPRCCQRLICILSCTAIIVAGVVVILAGRYTEAADEFLAVGSNFIFFGCVLSCVYACTRCNNYASNENENDEAVIVSV